MELTDFLLARIAEDEASAQQAIGVGYVTDERGHWHASAADYGESVIEPGDWSAEWQPRWAEDRYFQLVTRMHPGRVLAECDAKRRIVENHAQRYEAGGELHDAATLRLLALPYADHPDYDESWAV